MMTTPRRIRGAMFAAVTLVAPLVLTTPASAMEEWQIGAGPFVSASDVRNHNKMPLDVAGVNEHLAGETPDWQGALVLFAFGENFANHSLAKFTDNYNGRLSSHLPDATALHGTPSYANHALAAALSGTGPFAGAEPAVRRAFVEAGLQAVVLNWSRYELGESQRKGTMAEPNWSLENGSPKNWNEIFAFYWGPDGQHSAFATVEAVAGGPEVNAALFEALADGQEVLLTDTWAEVDAARVDAILDRASLLLLSDALDQAVASDDAGLAVAQAKAAGYWLAASDALGGDATTARAIAAALTAAPDRDRLADAAATVHALHID